ncbi:MAG: ribonuclease P protein component [Sulfurimonas sp.]
MLKEHREFQYVYKKGKSFHTPSMILFALPTQNIKKVGFTATKKIGNAVIRNRAKRRLRALFLEFSPQLKDATFVLVAKDHITQATYSELKSDFYKSLTRLKCLDV